MEVGPGEGRDLLQALEGKPHHAGLAVSWQKSADQVLGSMLEILGLWSPEAEAEAGGAEIRDQLLLHRELVISLNTRRL